MENLKAIDFNNPYVFLSVYFVVFAIIFLRYLFFTGAYYMVFRKILKEKFSDRILVTKKPQVKQLKREFIYSIYSALIFGFVGIIMILQWQNGSSKIYTGISTYTLWYLPISFGIFMFLHDTYYYWLHRWMHTSKWIKKFHMEHHRSIDTTVLTSFSFHPIESVLQALFLPVFTALIPINDFLLLFILLVMTISAIVNHAGVEVYSKKFNKGFFGYIIGATHHDVHHRNARKNFGLYFTFWDKLMNTNEEKFTR